MFLGSGLNASREGAKGSLEVHTLSTMATVSEPIKIPTGTSGSALRRVVNVSLGRRLHGVRVALTEAWACN